MINHDAVIQIESSGNPLEHNKVSNARGLYQITEKCLDDWNTEYPHIIYGMDDMFIPSINKIIGQWYLDVRIPHYLQVWGIFMNDGAVLACFNWGPTAYHAWHQAGQNLVDIPCETLRYIWKYKKELERKEMEGK